MPSKSDTPGLQRAPRKDGTVALTWVASRKAIAAGYSEKTVRLHYPDPSLELSHRCQELQTEMDAWLDNQGQEKKLDAALVRTMLALIKLYTTDPESPYRELDQSSQHVYDWNMRQLERTVGERRLDSLHGIDFRRWYKRFKQPKREGDPEHVTKAHGIMTTVRILFSFGIQWGVPHAKRLRDVLHEIKFRNAPAREEQVTYEMAVAFIKKAHELGYHEMALAQALQFEGTLRQTDVIGKWQPREDDLTDLEWVPGLLWQEIKDGILTHTPGKTADKTNQKVVLDLNDYELLVAEFGRLAVVPDIGPVIIDSHTGAPFRYHAYSRRWREIARLAGIPDTVWNRDSRAGGVTEGGDAGADIEDLRHHAAHSSIQTTQRYNRRTLAKTKRVAKARAVHRNKT